MNIELLNRPSSTVAKVSFSQGEDITAEGGSMVAMSGSLRIETTTHKRGKGSVLKAVKRLFSGESFFLNHYHANESDNVLWLASPLPGDMEVISVEPALGVVVSGGSFVAASGEVEMDSSWQGMKSLFSGENLFWLKMHGRGPLVVNTYGALYKVPVNGSYIVDTGHVVAFEESLNFSISKAGSSWWHSFLGGEGLVMKFEGQGTIWCQSHNAHEFGKFLGPMLRPRQR